MFNYFVQAQMTRNYNLYVQLTYHNSEKDQVSRGNSEWSHRK